MSKTILITGGTGFIGQRLVDDWVTEGHHVVVYSRRPEWVKRRWGGRVDAASSLATLNQRFDWLVNLAGEGIADKRWSDKRKQQLRQSRIDLSRDLLQWAKDSRQAFDLVLSGSAIGFYGSHQDDEQQGAGYTEQSANGAGFASQLCRDWETVAHEFETLCERLVILRTGVVLGQHGGMLARLWLPFSLALGGVIGSGQQVLSWIHLDDYRRAVHFISNNAVAGPVNMTSPQAVTNRQFTKTLGRVMSRPTIAPMPGFVAEMLFGEMSELLLEGQRVLPQQLLSQGFVYDYADIHDALREIHTHW